VREPAFGKTLANGDGDGDGDGDGVVVGARAIRRAAGERRVRESACARRWR
jgi:hypothetical protein